MSYRKGVSCIIRKNNKFLILHRTKNWRGWEFLKGGIKQGETERQALRRELKEETGNIRYSIKKTPYKIKYKWKKHYMKDNRMFSGSAESLHVADFLGNKKVKIDKTEHDGFKWVNAKDALRKISYEDRKKAFRYALRKYFN